MVLLQLKKKFMVSAQQESSGFAVRKCCQSDGARVSVIYGLLEWEIKQTRTHRFFLSTSSAKASTKHDSLAYVHLGESDC